MSPRDERPSPTHGGKRGSALLLHDDRSHDGPPWLRYFLATAAAAAAVSLAFLLVVLPERAPLLPGLVERRLEESGVSNPVNGVLLNFRAYDTLLELTVVIAAVIAVWSLDRGSRPLSRDLSDRREDPVLHELARLVVPISGVVAVYLVWAGGYQPGGGFQAGALLAGVGVLLAAGGYVPAFSAASRPVRIVVALSILAFVAVGLGSLVATGSFLDYPDGWAHGLILGLEAVIGMAVTVAFIEFFVDVPAVPASDPSLERVHPTGDPLGRMVSPGRDRDSEA